MSRRKPVAGYSPHLRALPERRVEAWYETHFARLTQLSERILRDRAAAEDIAQEALIRAWARRDVLREEDIGAWLSVVARNAALSSLRKSRDLPVGIQVVATAPDQADTRLLEIERRAILDRELQRLTPLQRDALEMEYLEELTPRELGARLGLSSGALRALAFRARRNLKKRLESLREDLLGVVISAQVSVHKVRRRVLGDARVTDTSSLVLSSSLGLLLAGTMVLQPLANSSVQPTLEHLGAGRSGAESVQSLGRPQTAGLEVERIHTTPAVRGPEWGYEYELAMGPLSYKAGRYGSTKRVTGPPGPDGKPVTAEERSYGREGPDPSDPVGMTTYFLVRELCPAAAGSCPEWLY